MTGKPVFTDDIAPKDCLVVKVLRSPHANAMVKNIRTDLAEKVEGIEAIYTWEDVPKERFTMAGQTYPEASPYDRLILDPHVRYVGDPVAIVAGENEACVDQALKRIKVEYEILPAILDLHEAKDSDILVHPEESWKALCPVGADNRRNLCASGESMMGTWTRTEGLRCGRRRNLPGESESAGNDGNLPDSVLHGFLWTAERNEFDADCIPCPQDPVECSWNLKVKIRVFKPRIGGGFGAKQTSVSEVYPAFVTWKTGKRPK